MSTVLSQERPKARKAHRCELCGQRIRPGDFYDRQTVVDGRDLWQWVNCRGPVGCNEVSRAIWADPDWRPYDDEGLTADTAVDWARDTVRLTGSPLAAAYLTRIEITGREYQARRRQEAS